MAERSLAIPEINKYGEPPQISEICSIKYQ